MDEDSAAYFDPAKKEIVLNENLRNSSTNVLAAHLAHEGTHVQWMLHGIVLLPLIRNITPSRPKLKFGMN